MTNQNPLCPECQKPTTSSPRSPFARLQAIERGPKASHRQVYPLPDEAVVVEAIRRSRWLTMVQAARHLGFQTGHGARQFLRAHGVRLQMRGRYAVVRTGTLDDLIERGCSDVRDEAREIGQRALAGRG